VSLEWFLDSVEKNCKQPEANYQVGNSTNTTNAIRASPLQPPVQPTLHISPKPPLSKKRTSSTKKTEPIDKPDEIEDDGPPTKKPKSITRPSKRNGKAIADPDKDEDSSVESDEEVKMKTVIKKGKAPVDELCSLASTFIQIGFL
jgi:poly [ADP-ribose] polymerase